LNNIDISAKSQLILIAKCHQRSMQLFTN